MFSFLEKCRNGIFHTLSSKIMLFLGLILGSALLGTAYLFIWHQEHTAMQQVMLDVNNLSDTVKNGTRYAMMTNHRGSIESVVEAAGGRKWVDGIRIVDKKGMISYSTVKSEIGTLTSKKSEICAICHMRSKPNTELPMETRTRIYTSADGSRAVESVNPIFNEETCYISSCHVHKPEQKMLGVVDVVMSLKPVDQVIRHSKRDFFLFALVFFFSVIILSGLSMSFFVGKRLAGLANSARQMARGDFTHDIKVKGNDEIGELARSFDEMKEKMHEKTVLLEKSRDEYQSLFERVPCYITVQDRDLKLVTYNREFEKEFGPVTGEYCYQAYKKRESPCENCTVALTMKDGRIHTSEEEGISRDGKKRFFLVQTAPVRNENREIVAVMEISTDITAVRLLQEELKRSELKYRIIFNNVPNPIFVLDPESYRILDVNDRAVSTYGYSRAELAEMSFLDLSPEEDRRNLAAGLAGGGDMLKVHHLQKQGKTIFVNVRISPSDYADKKVLIVTTSDITARLETEQQLIQAGKMATLGEMSAGVAHELNQPLSVIKTASHIILKRLYENRSIKESLLRDLSEEVDAQVERASKIINHMREFGRKPEIKKQKVQLHDVISNAFTVFGQQLKLRQIKVEREVPEDLPPILADHNQLEQVIINLILNARDAIEAKKALFPSANNENRITLRCYREDNHVVITLSDTGVGIPKNIHNKVFEPFFTTKGVGKGTGLGLSISYGIVRDYEGTISFESKEGMGTTFVIRFPVYKERV